MRNIRPIEMLSGHRSAVVLILLLFLVVAAAQAASGSPLPRNTSRYDFTALSTQLQSFISSGAETGFTFMVVRDGEIVFEQGFGTYSTTKITSIASAFKMPTSLAVAKLVDDWADEGISGRAEIKDVPLQMKVLLKLNGLSYGTTVDAMLKEKAGKSAQLKSIK